MTCSITLSDEPSELVRTVLGKAVNLSSVSTQSKISIGILYLCLEKYLEEKQYFKMLGYIQTLRCEQIIISPKSNKVKISDLLSQSNDNNEPHIIDLIVFPKVILKQGAWCYLGESSS